MFRFIKEVTTCEGEVDWGLHLNPIYSPWENHKRRRKETRRRWVKRIFLKISSSYFNKGLQLKWIEFFPLLRITWHNCRHHVDLAWHDVWEIKKGRWPLFDGSRYLPHPPELFKLISAASHWHYPSSICQYDQSRHLSVSENSLFICLIKQWSGLTHTNCF